MLGSIQGMVERATQAMAVLKERVNATQTELEKREVHTYNIMSLLQVFIDHKDYSLPLSVSFFVSLPLSPSYLPLTVGEGSGD